MKWKVHQHLVRHIHPHIGCKVTKLKGSDWLAWCGFLFMQGICQCTFLLISPPYTPTYSMIYCTNRSHHWLLSVVWVIMQPTSSNILEVRCNNTCMNTYEYIAGQTRLFHKQWWVEEGLEPSLNTSPDQGVSRQLRSPSLTSCYVPSHLQNTVATTGWSWKAMITSACMPFRVLYSRQ